MPKNQIEELKQYREAEATVTFVLITGRGYTGKINWFDNYTINITETSGGAKNTLTIPKHSILFYHEGGEPIPATFKLTE